MKQLLVIIITILVLAGGGFAGWHFWHQAKKASISPSSTHSSFLVIKEWGVQVPLPDDLQTKVTYRMGEKVLDPDNNQLQAARILLANTASNDNLCALSSISGQDFIDTAIQIIQVENDKPFNTQRYQGTMKKIILADPQHSYYLNYITPGCADANATRQIEELQGMLLKLEKAGVEGLTNHDNVAGFVPA